MSLNPFQDTPGSLPKPLRPVWELLRQRSIGSINEGLSVFSELAEESPAAADHIFDAVGVSPRPSARFVMALEGLEELRVAPRSELSHTLGGCTFDSATELAKLKLSLLGMG